MSEAFGPWDLVQPLAQGGMAEVFVARRRGDPAADFVCLKRVLPGHLGDPEFTRMFLDEARIARHLAHENLVRVLEADDIDGRLYLVMELVKGTTLAELMRSLRDRNRPMSLTAALGVVRPLCRGLAHAHALTVGGVPQNVVHRDVAPDNILISDAGDVKLTDFGVARARDRLARTRPGFTKGKEPWMSPEQALGEAIDHRADQFAAAVLLWEMVVGRPLFKDADGTMATLERVVRCVVPPPTRENPELPAALDGVVLRALAREPAHRYPDILAFEAALASLGVSDDEAKSALGVAAVESRFATPTAEVSRPDLSSSPAQTAPGERGGAPPWAWYAGAVAAGAGVGIGVALAFRALG